MHSSSNTAAVRACRASTIAGGTRVGALLLAFAALNLANPLAARASCSLIPIAAVTYPSLQGGIIAPIAAVGESVQIELNGCDPSVGFEKTATDNAITITFEPPTGPGNNTPVAVTGADIEFASNCTLPDGRCRTLRFKIPDTTALLPPYGLAGPARITVRDLANTQVAEIADLNLPTLGCDKEPETVFQKFTVVPAPNNYSDVNDNTTTEVLATVDGGNNLLVPLDYWGGGTRSVLAARPGAPEARFIEGDTPIETFTGSGVTVSQALATTLQNDPSLKSFDFVRSFSLTGRPLPPLLRVKSNGTGLYGTTDAAGSVLRIKRDDGSLNGLFDVTDRLFMNKGPIVIGSPSLTVQSPLPLRSLRSSSASVAYARDEARETVDLDADTDQADLVPQIVDPVTAAVTNTQEPVADIPNLFFTAPAIVASNSRVAYLLTERGQSGDPTTNPDDDLTHFYLRAFLSDGTQLHPASPLEADTSRLIDGQPMAISGAKIFFRAGSTVTDNDSAAVGALEAAISPDGNHVYNSNGGVGPGLTIDAWDILPDGNLDGIGAYVAPYFAGPGGIAITPDGTNIYVGEESAQNLVVLQRDTLTGGVAFVETQVGGTYPPGPALLGPHAVAISPDSNFVYVSGKVSDSIDVYERTGINGELTFVETEVNGFGGVVGLDNPEALVMSPDGLDLYATADGSVAAFSRNVGTGALSFIEAEQDGVAGVDGLNGAALAAISPDGKHLYVPAAFDDAISVFERDTGTGALTFLNAYVEGFDGAGTLLGATGAAVSPDGQRVYVAARLSAVVSAFRRNSVTGALTFENTMAAENSYGPVLRVTEPIGIAVKSDAYLLTNVGTILYVTDPQWGVQVLRADHRLAVLDTDSCAGNCPTLSQTPFATRVTVAGENAGFLTPESGDNIDRNGNGDPVDDIVNFYNTSGIGSTTSLNIAGNRLAGSATLLAFTVPEANEGGGGCTPTIPPGGCDLNDDDDNRDDVLHVYEIAPGPGVIVNTGLTADRIAVTGDTVVFISPDDGMLHLYAYNSGSNTGVPSVVAPASDFIVDGSIIAFRTDEAVVGQSLNTDTDTVDLVMQAYDLSTSSLSSTGRSAIECRLPGCDPNLPYKPSDGTTSRTIAFLTDEQQEAPYPVGDLDIDGDAEDIVLTLYNVRAQVADTIGTTQSSTGCDKNADCEPSQECDAQEARCLDVNPPEITPFPEEPFDGTLVTAEVRESSLGDVPDKGDCDEEDINLDGDCDDTVVVIVGDSDEDGTVDDTDVCREVDQDEQVDDDGDLLGDVQCDPHLPPACGNTPRLTCRNAGKSSVQFKSLGDPKKNQFKFSWGKGDQTTLSAFGDPANDLDGSYSLCIYDGSVATQPITRAVALAGPRFCGNKRCWSAVTTKGFKLSDKNGVPLGVTGLNLTSGDPGKAKVGVKGKGKNLSMPALPLTVPVTVQLVVNTNSGEECWTAMFNSAEVQSAEQWKAKN